MAVAVELVGAASVAVRRLLVPCRTPEAIVGNVVVDGTVCAGTFIYPEVFAQTRAVREASGDG